MIRFAVAALFCAAMLFPAPSRADCEADTKSCEDTKAGAQRCAQTYGFRAKVACADWSNMVDRACSQAQKSCGETGTSTPASRRNQ
ncbi:MAG TPA: hypothetical protein VGJ94_06590 [Syntrophorhabdaceae bacterium]|jgi:hypothetical protein